LRDRLLSHLGGKFTKNSPNKFAKVLISRNVYAVGTFR
jgi:hypothetical protein